MAWFLNHYRCERCHKVWTDEWSCMCDDECPQCGFRDMTPFDSTDSTTLVAQEGHAFIVLRSSDDAEHDPDYSEIGRFPTRDAAEVFIRQLDQPSGQTQAYRTIFRSSRS